MRKSLSLWIAVLLPLVLGGALPALAGGGKAPRLEVTYYYLPG